MNVDGSGLRLLLSSSAIERSLLVWSPDGAQIAFTSTRDGRPQIYVMNVDGTQQTNISRSTTSDVQPAWRPRG